MRKPPRAAAAKGISSPSPAKPEAADVIPVVAPSLPPGPKKPKVLALDAVASDELSVLPVQDVTDRFFDLSADLLCVLDAVTGHVRRANPAWNAWLGKSGSAAAMVGKRLAEIAHADDRASVEGALPTRENRTARVCTARFPRNPRGGGSDYRWLHWVISPPDERGFLYATARDVTEEKEADAAVRWQANHDTLTGLPNRDLLQDRLGSALATANRRSQQLAVLFLDLDRFKPINDSLGHAAGDALLKEIAERLRSCLREEDTVARLGGDEFVILLPVVAGTSDALRVGHKLLQAVARPLRLMGHDLYITASIGVALSPTDGTAPEDLLRNADMAMYHAKNEGRSRVALHNDTAGSGGLERIVLQSRLRQAVDREEFDLHYQPQVSLTSGEMIGVEALMRWRQTDMGLVSPATFIPLAEETGLIGPMGSWAVREASRQAADWQKAGYGLRVSVNLSASQLSDGRFPEVLKKHLAAVGLAPWNIDLELTESTFIRHDPAALDTLRNLKEIGVRLSVDDFGTGYSSLSYLRRFPIDGVKVDKSFITNLEHSSADEAVVRAVIDLSHTLGLKVIAEGVETTAQRDKLHTLGCDAMQGYLFSAAVPPLEVPPLIATAARNGPLPARNGRH